jgi:hypothetical protein
MEASLTKKNTVNFLNMKEIMSPELVGAVFGATLSAIVLIIQAYILGKAEARRDRIQNRKEQVREICITAVNLYRVEEALLAELERCGCGKAGNLKKEIRLRALGMEGKEALMFPVQIKRFYKELSNLPIPATDAQSTESRKEEQ